MAKKKIPNKEPEFRTTSAKCGPCRIASLKGFAGVLMGRDMAGVFTEGHVYSAINYDGFIILRDLGPHALIEKHKPWMKGARLNQLATSGTYCLTEAEYDAEHVQKQKDENG